MAKQPVQDKKGKTIVKDDLVKGFAHGERSDEFIVLSTRKGQGPKEHDTLVGRRLKRARNLSRVVTLLAKNCEIYGHFEPEIDEEELEGPTQETPEGELVDAKGRGKSDDDDNDEDDDQDEQE